MFFNKTSKKFFESLSPKRRIAALVDAVLDRLNEKYKFVGHAKLVEGGFTFEIKVVDNRPQDRIEFPDKDPD